ncbi:MAG: M1 family metallopeptidase [Marinoscillum sp.]|uniref:M1 family metallopeptidase n=1 Tax=Marinoscillum sp. TaxID=2024838 RepID=UPI0032F6DFD7
MNPSKSFTLLLVLFLSTAGFAQKVFTRQDTLRGSITAERAWWDLQHYDLSVSIDTAARSIEGFNVITYKVVSAATELQIDLQAPMEITEAKQGDQLLDVRHEGDAHFVSLVEDQPVGSIQKLTIRFAGTPVVARRPPWDGGFTWNKDENGKPFIATSNQGIGASIWWPCKDHPADEPDNGVTMNFTVPKDLTAVGNGRLIKVKKGKGTRTFTWQVTNPINSYGVNLNVGDYVKFEEKYDGEKGNLDMIYYVLSYNLDKAKTHFQDARRTMEALEYWFGPYPFYEDSYKLVEVPYLGMEHQSSVTYGNGYELGYRGRDLSLTGWGLKWDYIIIHESGHEWFANNITYKDAADMWIHESFTTYSEGLFVDYHYGKEAGAAYVRGMRYGIGNEEPMIGPYGVNGRGADLYNKGSNVLHTLRQWVNDDTKWREILRGLNETFYHQTVTTADVEGYISEKSGLDLTSFFDQYLRDPRVPVLEYFTYEGNLLYRWTNCIEGFDMPVRINVGDESYTITPTTRWNFRDQEKISVEDPALLKVDSNYYIYPVFTTGAK